MSRPVRTVPMDAQAVRCARAGCNRQQDCSHTACPMRKPLTAGPPDLVGRWHFPDEDARRWPGPRE